MSNLRSDYGRKRIGGPQTGKSRAQACLRRHSARRVSLCPGARSAYGESKRRTSECCLREDSCAPMSSYRVQTCRMIGWGDALRALRSGYCRRSGYSDRMTEIAYREPCLLHAFREGDSCIHATPSVTDIVVVGGKEMKNPKQQRRRRS